MNRRRKVKGYLALAVAICVQIAIAAEPKITLFSDDFDDGDISDWTVTTDGMGLGVFEVTTVKCVSPLYSVHMHSTGNFRAQEVSSVYDSILNLNKDYYVSFKFLVPHTGNHWFEIFNNRQIYIVSDNDTDLKSYMPTQLIMSSLATNRWWLMRSPRYRTAWTGQ